MRTSRAAAPARGGMWALAFAAGLVAGTGSAPAWASVERGFIPLADGVALNYVLTLPEAPGPFPVALTYGPYSEGYRLASGLTQYPIETWLAEGYAHLSVSFRGTGCSSGTFRAFDAREWGADGAEVVDWAARQPWSSGRVGMYGHSFPGTSQLATAAFSTSGHLKAIAPWGAFPDLYRDIAYPGGVFDGFVPLWLAAGRAFVGLSGGGVPVEPLPACQLNPPLYLGQNAAAAAEVLAHPYLDEYYAAQPERFLGRIAVPVLGAVAWQDTTIYSRSFGAFQRALDPATTWVIAGNGAHDGSAEIAVPPRQALLRFFERYVKGVANGWEETPHVVVAHEVNADHEAAWLSTHASWSALERATMPLVLHLHAGGRLDLASPLVAEASQAYAFPLPTSNTPADWMGQDAFGLPQVPGGSTRYTTAALSTDAEFLGSGSVDLWLSSTATDTDVQVLLSEVRPDGQEQFVQNGWLRWSRRRVDAQRSTALFPLQTHAQHDVQPLEPGRAVPGRIELQPFNHVFRAGSAIRLTVDTPGKWFVPLSTPGLNTIHHAPSMDSQLVLGWLPAGVARAPLPACGTLLNQPCRANAEPVPEGALDLPAAARSPPASSGSGGGTFDLPMLALLLLLAVQRRRLPGRQLPP